MKAIFCTKYGGPEVLKLETVDTPEPGRGKILIRTYATVVSPSDCASRSGKPWMIHLFSGLTRPKTPVLGDSMAGEIIAFGDDGEAAAVCDGAITALPFLRDAAEIREGQKILINGASGSVGSYAVQLAVYYGAKVTAVCGKSNIEML